MKTVKRTEVFPSPTGVNHYEYQKALSTEIINIYCFRPQQGLTIMNYDFGTCGNSDEYEEFPSPTGVNHYE